MFEEIGKVVDDFFQAVSDCGVKLADTTDDGMKESKKAEKMVLYLSGSITHDSNYIGKFRAAHGEIEAKGHVVLNPAALPAGMSYDKYMDIDFAMIRAADGIVMLDGWKNSAWAKGELRYAIAAGKKVYFGTDNVPEVNE